PDQGNGFAGTAFTGSDGWPNKIARVLDDGGTQLWQYTHNSNGKLTKSIDPLGRITSYQHETNNIDLLRVVQRNPSGASTDPDGQRADKIHEYRYDPQDPPHTPHTYSDAAGQTTHYFYSPSGQITDIQNAKNETTHYEYSDGTIDGVPNGY